MTVHVAIFEFSGVYRIVWKHSASAAITFVQFPFSFVAADFFSLSLAVELKAGAVADAFHLRDFFMAVWLDVCDLKLVIKQSVQSY